MNIPNVKDILQKLSVLKNNLSLLASIIIAVVALLLFIPTQLMSGKLKTQIEAESVRMGRSIRGKDPVSRRQWEVEQVYQDAHVRDANQVELLARQSTQRELLSYEIFPEPTSSSTLLFEQFGNRFRAGVEAMVTSINGVDRPSDSELQKSLQSAATGARGRMGRPMTATPGRLLYRSLGMRGGVNAEVLEQVCIDRAKSASVYANPADIGGYAFWAEYKFDTGIDESVKECWYWQLGYWMIEDIIATIGACNAESDSVLTAPVKRLLEVEFALKRRSMASLRLGRQRARRDADDVKPSYVLSAKDGLTAPCTARYTTDEDGIDVVHFNVVLVVRADAVLEFMDELCSAREHKFRGITGTEPEQTFKHNQITVLESNALALEEGPTHDHYRYGDDAVVELDLICEYIFNSEGYKDIKPKVVTDEVEQLRQDPGPRRRMR
jgi:hypothetical protein